MKEQLQAFTPLRSVSQRHLDSITSANGKRNCYSSENLQTETWCPTDVQLELTLELRGELEEENLKKAMQFQLQIIRIDYEIQFDKIFEI